MEFFEGESIMNDETTKLKGSFYFPHDYNARNDDKILEIRAKYGNEGYALFFYCLETMVERGDGYIIGGLLGGLSLGYGVAMGWLSDFLDFCVKIDAFRKDETGYYSERIVDHLNQRKMFSDKGKEGADKRWKNRGAIPLPIAGAMQRKGKERKEDTKYIEEASQVIETYNQERKKNITTSRAWLDNFITWRKDYSLEQILQAIRSWKQVAWLRDNDVDLVVFFRTNQDWIGKCLQSKKQDTKDYKI
jgi:hypothetical protein